MNRLTYYIAQNKNSNHKFASLEQAGIANEKIFYSGLDNGIVIKNTVAAYPNDPYTNPNDFIQKLRGDNTKIGAGILLKVMSGDKLNVHASAWYKLNGATPDPPLSPLPDILFSLINGIPGISGNKLTAAQLGNGVLNPSVANFLNTRDATANTNRPRAWLNIIVFDEQMNMVMTNDGKNSYFEQAGATNVLKVFNITNREITKNGYVYIYVSNETPNIDAFFDNLQATHIRGPLIEEEHYYGFGLMMAGISSKASNFGNPENKRCFNGGNELQNKEFADGSGLEWYATNLRSLDPQLGRWWQIDSKPDMAVSPYSAMNNNPLSFNDPLGDTIMPNVTYNYSKTGTPTKNSDLGETITTNLKVTSPINNSNVNITVDISTSLSEAFTGTTFQSNIEVQNPGLEREVKAHEEGHSEQIMDAANKSISIPVMIDGKVNEFSGTADKVIVIATAAFKNSNAASTMSQKEVSSFVDVNIATPALQKMNSNIYNAMNPTLALESNANNRAIEKLGAETIKYINGTPIIFNGIKLQQK